MIVSKDTEWLVSSDFENIEDYLECYFFLTSVNISNIKINNDLFSSLYAPPARYEFYIPVTSRIKNGKSLKYNEDFWLNYAWLCRTRIRKNNSLFEEDVVENWFHFEMTSKDEQKYPPIPKFLVEFYRQSVVL